MKSEFTPTHNIKTSFVAAVNAVGGVALPPLSYAGAKLLDVPEGVPLMIGLGTGAGMGISSLYASKRWEPFLSSGYAGLGALLTAVYNADSLRDPLAYKPDYVVEADRFVTIASTTATSVAAMAPESKFAKAGALTTALAAATLATTLIVGNGDKRVDATTVGKPPTHQTLSLANRIPV